MAEDEIDHGRHTITPPRRQHPARMRKKNRFLSDESEWVTKSPRKKRESHANSQFSSPSRAVLADVAKVQTLSTPDKRVAQSVGVRLRNLLKLPKAHKWVCYEWFYSNLDAPLFLSDNDFNICVRETFPQLKAKKLHRVEWAYIRRLMGKPRRCSAAFFAEERTALNVKRDKIRLLQQRKVSEVSNLKDLPESIPLPLVIGTKVTARLRHPQDGLFAGSIEALDTVHNAYRVTFERPGLGTHSIPDYEVLSHTPSDMMPLSMFRASKQRSRQQQAFMTPPRFVPGSPQLDNDPLLGGSPSVRGHMLSLEGGTYGGFPIKFLVLVCRLAKILKVKKEVIKELWKMNTQAEKKKSMEEAIGLDFQRRYANTVIELERLNKDLNDYLQGVQEYCQEIAPEIQAMEDPIEMKKRCEEEAEEMVQKSNITMGRKSVKSDRSLTLITKLTSILLQIRNYAENDMSSFQINTLQDALQELRQIVDPANMTKKALKQAKQVGTEIDTLLSFQQNVEVHVNHIQSGLSQVGNLHAFTEAQPFTAF